MLSLIIVFLFALGVAYFAIQNTFAVHVVFASTVFHDVPLYFLVIASVLVGIILASLINSLDTLSAYMKIRGKDHRIHSDQKAIDDLQQKIHDLEIENAKLKVKDDKIIEEKHLEEKAPEHRPFFRHNLNPHA